MHQMGHTDPKLALRIYTRVIGRAAPPEPRGASRGGARRARWTDGRRAQTDGPVRATTPGFKPIKRPSRLHSCEHEGSMHRDADCPFSSPAGCQAASRAAELSKSTARRPSPLATLDGTTSSPWTPEEGQQSHASTKLSPSWRRRGRRDIAGHGPRPGVPPEPSPRIRPAAGPLGPWPLNGRRRSVAVVGTASRLTAAERAGQEISRQLVAADYVVVSGLATGIDAARTSPRSKRAGVRSQSSAPGCGTPSRSRTRSFSAGWVPSRRSSRSSNLTRMHASGRSRCAMP